MSGDDPSPSTVKHMAPLQHIPNLHRLSTSTAASCRFEKMALMLLHEKHNSNESAVSGYIEQLPSDFDTLLHWSDQEMQLLMYPHLMQQVQLA